MTSERGEIKTISDKLKLFENLHIGYGSEGVDVFEGLFEDRVPVAVKRMIKTRFATNEAELLRSSNSHENIVRYYGSEMNSNFVFIAMELCAGTLDNLVKGNYEGPEVGNSNEVLRQIAFGLEYLHAKGIIHRDLKPSNILISIPDATVPPRMKLADFGISKHKPGDMSVTKSTSQGIGTVGWSAPEMFDPNVKKYDTPADIFSLGCVFGYVLTGGHHPFGDGPVRIANILNGKLDWEGEQRIADQDFKQLIKDMMARYPNGRPKLGDILAHRFFCSPQVSPVVQLPSGQRSVSVPKTMSTGSTKRAILTADLTKGRPTEILGLKWEWLGNRKRDVNEFKFVSSLYAIQHQRHISETSVLNIGPSSVVTSHTLDHTQFANGSTTFNISYILRIMSFDGDTRPLYIAADHVNHLHVYRVIDNRIQRIVSDVKIESNKPIETMLLSPGDGSTIERSPVRILIFCRNFEVSVVELAQHPNAPDNSPHQFTLKRLANSRSKTSIQSVAWCGPNLIALSHGSSVTIYSLGPAPAARVAPAPQADLIPKFTFNTLACYSACGSPCSFRGSWLLAARGLNGELVVWSVSEDLPVNTDSNFNKGLHKQDQKVKCFEWLPINSGNEDFCIPLIASAYESGLVCIWNVKTDEIVQRFNAGSGVQRLTSMSYAPSGNLMAVAFENFTAEIWRVPIKDDTSGPTDESAVKMDEIQGSAEVAGITWHPSGRAFAAVFSDGKVTFRHASVFN